MDGFEGNSGVMILAATNRPESLDPALTRPGRFDRRVPVELPDLAGREAILKVHAKKIKMADDVDLHTIARMAAGASGAELANIINEAALRAVRNSRTVENEADLEESLEVIIAGYQKKNAVLSDKEKMVVAYHETGHALVAAMQSHSAPVQKITIIPRTSGTLGYTMQVDTGDKYLMTKEEIENKIATYTGGRAAEEVIFGEITTGASNDIEQATKLARAMITRYGMSDSFGMVALETVNNQYLGGDASLACSADTQNAIDREVMALVIVYGILALLMGIGDIVMYIRASRFTGFAPMLSLVSVILSVMSGIMLITYPDAGALILGVLFPLWFITHCTARLARLEWMKSIIRTGTFYCLMALNITGIIIGFLLLISPYHAVISTVYLVGAYLVLLGAESIVLAFSKAGSR